MAITLDELLGRNTAKSAAENTAERFPSYDDFQTSRKNSQPTTREQEGYNYFAPRQSSVTRSEESVLQRESTRPYEAPRGNEYQSRDYAFYNNMQSRAQTIEPQYQNSNRVEPQYQNSNRVEPQYQNSNRTENAGYNRGTSYMKPEFSTAEKRTNFYEFTATDCDRLGEEELYQKLSHTNSNRRPSFDHSTDGTIAVKSGVFAPANGNKQKTEAKSESTKKHARLNTKGKVLLSVYLAVIVLVAVLVIVNAGDLNRGTAKTPSSSMLNNSISSTVGFN